MTPFGPGGAPREGIRPWLAGVAALFGVVLVPLMFADRVPGLLDQVSDNIENTFPDLYWDTIKPWFPEADVAMHLLLFSGAAVLVGLLCWSWKTFVLGQMLVFGGGMAIEILQPVFTSSRNIEAHDMVANVIGQTIGIVVAVAVIGAWSLWSNRRSAHLEPSHR